MTKWLLLVSKNLIRSRRRTLLTLGSVALALFVLTMLQTVIATLRVDVSSRLGEIRVAAIERYSGPRTTLPERYGARLANIPHVTGVTPMGYTVLGVGEKEALYIALLIEPETYRYVFASTASLVPRQQYTQFIKQKNGVLVGEEIMENYGWQVGDRIVATSLLHKTQVPLVICGTLEGEEAAAQQLSTKMLLNWKYYGELRGKPGWANIFWLRLNSSTSILPVMQSVSTSFVRESHEVTVETESAMLNHLASFTATIKLIIQFVAAVVLFTILVVAANTVALSMRERKKEIAVMKAIGFTPQQVIWMVVTESTVTALIGGILGVSAAYALFTWGGITLSVGLAFEFFVTKRTVALGAFVAFLIGILGSLFPAYNTSRVNVIRALASL